MICSMCFFVFVFFDQKTAYEMLIIDWSSDVCSSDLEFLSHVQARQRNAQTVSGRLVHLTEHHGHFGLFQVVHLNDAGFSHFVVEVVTFASTLAHTSKHRQTAVRFGDVVDQFQHVHGLAHAGAAKQADLTALGERANQVNRSEEHTSELQSLMRISYAVFCLK